MRDPQDYPLEESIIASHLEDLGHNRLPKIAKALGVSIEDIKSPQVVPHGENFEIAVNLTEDSENPAGEWNRMVIECLGRDVKVWVNGDLVNHGTDTHQRRNHRDPQFVR